MRKFFILREARTSVLLNMRKAILKWIKYVSVGAIALAGASAAYQAVSAARDKQRFPPPGEMIDVGDGYSLHLNCSGKGSPTVILEAALGGTSLDWSLIQPKIAEFTRVCSYDRAGYGWSDTGVMPRTSEQTVKELRALLKKAGINGPYILVGHSFGGFHTRLFANQFVSEIVGIVLIDASHENQISYLPPEKFQAEMRQINVAHLTAPLGVMRLAGNLGLLPAEFETFVKKYPAELQPALRSFYYRGQQFSAWKAEYEAAEISAAQVRESSSLKDIPLIVITAGTLEMPPDVDRNEANRKWLERQTQLARLSANSAHIIAEKSDHYVQLDQPDKVVESVSRLVENARP